MGRVGEARDSALMEASEHFRAGRISAARSALADPQSAAELIEATRFALHAGDYSIAEGYARRAAALDSASGEQRTLARVMRDCARGLRNEPAEESFDLKDLTNADALLGEIVYFLALTAFHERKFEVSENWLRIHTPSDPSLHARYLNLRGIIAGARENFIEQAHLTNQSIELLRTEARDNVTLLAASAHLLAALVREVPFVGGAETLEAIERETPWTDELTSARFHILRSVAWMHALHSRFVPAMQLLHKALPLARTNALRVYAYLDQAMIGLFAGDHTTPKATFALADEIAQQIDWPNVHDETIAVLPFMAQVAVDIDVPRARVYCDLARQYAANIETRYLLAHGTRLPAFVSEAIALAYDDDTERSTSEAEDAYRRLDKIGYGWRAGRMAIHLLRLTGEPEWRERAEQHLAQYGESPFARILARLSKARRRLSARERQVLALLQRRRSIDEIASELGIKPNTVRIHIGKIHYTFGVNRTSKLLALLESA